MQYAGPQGLYPGLDQVNVILPQLLKGLSLVKIVLSVDGQSSNPVEINLS